MTRACSKKHSPVIRVLCCIVLSASLQLMDQSLAGDRGYSVIFFSASHFTMVSSGMIGMFSS